MQAMAQRILDVDASRGYLNTPDQDLDDVLPTIVDDIKTLWHDKGICEAY